jgi:hypothetical protein
MTNNRVVVSQSASRIRCLVLSMSSICAADAKSNRYRGKEDCVQEGASIAHVRKGHRTFYAKNAEFWAVRRPDVRGC